ncbi:hypothetical protein FB451DRAFT_1371687 [Mycena latifolia]|nr:hypothetical protein FB451DRAFT_1371687 [Mycena latifolia]
MSDGDLDMGIMNCQAEVHRFKSEYMEAHDITRQIMHNVSRDQDPFQYAFVLLNTAQIGVEMGVSKQILQGNIDTANALLNNIATPVVMTFRDTVQAALHLREGELLAAMNLFKQSLEASWGRVAEVELVTYCLERLGDVHQWTQTSSTWTLIFLVHSLKFKQKLEIYKAFQFVGDIFLAQGNQDTAMSLFTVALDGFAKMDIHRSRAECMLRLGDILQLQGDFTHAADFWKMARPLFERSSQAKQVTWIDERLSGISDDILNAPVGGLNHVAELYAPSSSPEESAVGTSSTSSSIEAAESLASDNPGSILVSL